MCAEKKRPAEKRFFLENGFGDGLPAEAHRPSVSGPRKSRFTNSVSPLFYRKESEKAGKV